MKDRLFDQEIRSINDVRESDNFAKKDSLLWANFIGRGKRPGFLINLLNVACVDKIIFMFISIWTYSILKTIAVRRVFQAV